MTTRHTIPAPSPLGTNRAGLFVDGRTNRMVTRPHGAAYDQLPDGNSPDQLTDLRVALERLLADSPDLPGGMLKNILALLDEHVPMQGDADPFEKIKSFLASKGLSGADVEKALSIASGKAEMPRSGAEGGPGGQRERPAMDAANRDFETRFPESSRIGLDYFRRGSVA
jgi:hypothetical protein